MTNKAAKRAAPTTRTTRANGATRPDKGTTAKRPVAVRREAAAKAASSAPARKRAANSHPTSKAQDVLKLLEQKNGASIAQLQKATGWQAHSVRGFLSSTVKKRLGRTLVSKKAGDGVRRYRVTAG